MALCVCGDTVSAGGRSFQQFSRCECLYAEDATEEVYFSLDFIVFFFSVEGPILLSGGRMRRGNLS